MESKDVIGFYNEFVENQRRIGVNERIHGLYKKLRKAGLKPNSKVLELGCGIGVLTGSVARTVTT
ncbi:MAG: class I SAM-dependent methyltransferase, partial [Flavobacteriales bacterium]